MFMKKVMLGVSLYPEQETLEEIDAYLKKASTYGFKKSIYKHVFSTRDKRRNYCLF